MKKNRKQRKPQSARGIPPKQQQREVTSGESQEYTDDDGKVDYGGLPNRDLKKNLGGCG